MMSVQKTKMMSVENNQECFVQLWRKLERTRRLLGGQYKRFCIRNVLKAWFPADATDDNFIWEVCHLAAVDGEPQERSRPSGHQLLENQSESSR